MAPSGFVVGCRACEGGGFCAVVSRYYTCTCSEGGLAAKRSDGLQTIIIIYCNSFCTCGLKAVARLITCFGSQGLPCHPVVM